LKTEFQLLQKKAISILKENSSKINEDLSIKISEKENYWKQVESKPQV
jgi:hypothetical protein